jgi:dTDP-4-dehydrorhamnose 3,5-epimerase
MTVPVSTLPAGVAVRPLATHVDDRGAFTELFRDEWGTGVAPVQWNVVSSGSGVLRGVHCHPVHADALVVVHGTMRLGLADLRPEAPTAGLACVVELTGESMELVTIPPGVAHGFSFPTPSIHIYAVDRVWDPADELGCRWDDPGLGIEWGHVSSPRISERDERLGTLDELRAALALRRRGGV